MKKHLVATVAALAILVPGAAMAQTIKIGLLAPQEGVFTEPGNDGIRGFKMALNKVDGEINGKKIEWVLGPTDATPDTALRQARTYRGDKLIRVAAPHRLLDPDAGPLVAVRLHVLTRKTLGGIETDLDARVLGADGQPMDGLFAAGEAAGFGGGGMHGYRSLEGTFLGGCLFSGRQAGRGAIAATS